MRPKLQDCQNFRTQSYNHTGGFIEGDKVWFQPMNGTLWLGPAAVLCQRGQSVWLHTHGDVKKVAACRVKPFQLVDRELLKSKSEKSAEEKHVMLEDRFKNVDDLQEGDNLEDEKNDIIGAKYLKVANTVSFSDLCLYTVYF